MKGVRVGIVTAVALVAVAPWVARGHAETARPDRARSQARPRMTMNQAVQMVERRFQARVLRAETRKQSGQTVYVLRLLDRSGRVFTVRVDAATGRLL